jgi:hypothetical protein
MCIQRAQYIYIVVVVLLLMTGPSGTNESCTRERECYDVIGISLVLTKHRHRFQMVLSSSAACAHCCE